MNLSGVFAPIITPFDSRGELDVTALRADIDRWMQTPLAGLIVLGSTGEAVLLDEDEADRALATARERIPSDRLLIAGTGRESTRATIAAAIKAGHAGADAVLVRTPSFFKSQMSTEVFLRHYWAVADAAPVPVLLYNFPAVTGVNLLPAAAAKLSDHPNIIGMKESGGDIGQLSDLVAQTRNGFKVLAGSAPTFYAALAMGAVGGILALACVIPELCVRLFELARQGRHAEAVSLQRDITPLARLIGPTYGVAGLKAALDLAGYTGGSPRPPLLPAPEAAVNAIREQLDMLSAVLRA
jgi:4-hydroxy-2-oxoglutarate aldolase